ncbi:MAG: translation initiation factor IF-3 [Elusimicrobia bacterium RIFCSPLOWO2_12_FULL_59_9]|nr:MAG: translation initiation factor IF-3 [Elusimicrobia bacterium RIFCSPLOWO2_12_FULL_59_9]
MNNRILAPEVRLIDADGTQIGIRPLREALGIARTRGMDLIEIAPDARPPVCKILDYSKYKYDKRKKERVAKKNQKSGLLKEIRVSPRIAAHDLEVKLNHVRDFLKENDKVRITVVFRGRENQYKDLGYELLEKVKVMLQDVADIERSPAGERNTVFMMLSAKHA